MANTVDRLAGAASSLAFKAPCRIASTANISSLSGFQTIDGVLPTSTEHESLRRVLVKNQTTAAQNGIYIMGTGAWARAKDLDGNNDFRQGTRVFVWGGASQSGGYVVTSSMDPNTFAFNSSTITFTTQATVDITNFQFADNTGLYDDSGNEQLILQKTASAVNFLEVTNSTAGSAPALSAAGDDAAINLKLTAKSTGAVTSTSVTLFDAAMTSSAITASGLITASAGLTAATTLTSSGILASGAVFVANSLGVSSNISAPALKLGPSTGFEIAMYGAVAVVNATSATTATNLLASGISIVSSAETTWRMDAPVPGLIKHVFRISVSTATTGTVTLVSGAILSSAVSTADRWTMTGVCGLSLVGVTTALYSVVSRFPTTSQISIT